MRFLFLLFATSIVLHSCTIPKSDVDRLHDEVMQIHDDVMPKMRDIYSLKKSLKRLVEEGDEQAAYHMDLLDKADDAMMDWMRDYRKPLETRENKIEYLQGEKSKIQEVRDLMLSSIKAASDFINIPQR